MATTKGRVNTVSISRLKGTPKTSVPQAFLKVECGIVGDAHAGNGHRQVSLLSIESIARLREKGLDVSPGDFAENITVEDLDLAVLKVGSRLRIGQNIELEVTQIGKKCHQRCAVFEKVGDCIMPRCGVFARVNRSGRARAGDVIEVLDD